MDQNNSNTGIPKKTILIIAIFLSILFIVGGYFYISKQNKTKTTPSNSSFQQNNPTQTPSLDKQQNTQINTPVQNQTNPSVTQSQTTSTKATINPTAPATNTSQDGGFLR